MLPFRRRADRRCFRWGRWRAPCPALKEPNVNSQNVANSSILNIVTEINVGSVSSLIWSFSCLPVERWSEATYSGRSLLLLLLLWCWLLRLWSQRLSAWAPGGPVLHLHLHGHCGRGERGEQSESGAEPQGAVRSALRLLLPSPCSSPSWTSFFDFLFLLLAIGIWPRSL